MEWGPVEMDEAGGRTQLKKIACRTPELDGTLQHLALDLIEPS